MEFAILNGFEFKKVKSSSTQQTYVCKAEGCSWRIHASTSPCKSYFMVKSFQPEHKCQAVRSNRLATATWIATVMAIDFRDDPNIGIGRMRQKLKEKYGLTSLSKHKLFRQDSRQKEGQLEFMMRSS